MTCCETYDFAMHGVLLSCLVSPLKVDLVVQLISLPQLLNIRNHDIRRDVHLSLCVPGQMRSDHALRMLE